ncbi:nuclear transport factor 2 family protein [Thalassobaculum sp.]|uniref:nuclear transport factor 2 family protein n=1 Tax=Thalassobaculum sp. TaxID=2022740 RepID=UPI0032EBBB39
MPTTDPNRLLDIEAIKRLKAEYCRFVDTKQWDRLSALFAEETMFEGFGSAPTGSTARDFIKGISHRMTGAVTIHHVCNPEIAFLDPDRARGIWAMTDLVELAAGMRPKEAPDSRGFRGYGHYQEEYRRDGGRWKFCFLRLTRLRLDPLPDDFPPMRHDLLAADPNWLDTANA